MKEVEIPSGCQLKSIYENMESFAEDLDWKDRAYLLSLRLLSAVLRRVRNVLSKVAMGRKREEVIQSVAAASEETPSGDGLRPGDLVRIKSLEEIKACLKDGKTKGLEFMPSMARYCGREVKILKKINYIFDERAWKMRKCNSYILEGLICDGVDMFSREGCDRCCFFFWKSEWFEKIGSNAQKI